MSRNLSLIIVFGLLVGFSNTGYADERITINACGYGAVGCIDGRSGPDYSIGEYRSVTPGLYKIEVIDGAWGSFELTDFTSPHDVHLIFGQGWLWSLIIYNGVDSYILGDHSTSAAFVYPTDYPSASSAQAAALAHNIGDSVHINTTGDLWFYVYDPYSRSNSGVLTFDITAVSEPEEPNGAVKTWEGAVSNYAHVDANWAEGTAPVAGDNIIFDNDISSADCIWDINPTLKSFSMRGGYSGRVALNSDLTMTGYINILSGTLDPGSATISFGGDWNYFHNSDKILGDVLDMDGVNNLDVLQNMLMSLEEVEADYCGDINHDGDIDIMDVLLTLRKAKGENNPDEQCEGALFLPGTSKVVLTGTDQTIKGDTIFYDLEKIGQCPGDTLYFKALSMQTILGKLSLKGEAGCKLALSSTNSHIPWYLNPQGTRNISFTTISDLKNMSFVNIPVTDSTDNGGNDGVSFGGSECVCMDDGLIFAWVGCGSEKC